MRLTMYSGMVGVVFLSACRQPSGSTTDTADSVAAAPQVVKPVVVTDPVRYDTDDPAIWINPQDAAQSLIIGTDKGGDTGDGALYVFDLAGKIVAERTVTGLRRPNNVDVAYGLSIAGGAIDIAVCTERNADALRVFKLPGMTAVDNGGIPVFEGDTARALMGIALYKDPAGNVYAIVSRKSGPDGSYLWQYLLYDDGRGHVAGRVVRKFGRFTGGHEIESVAADNALGYVYYSDEGAGVRKYYAHPDSAGRELALFGQSDFRQDNEGISIYATGDSTGYILVSDQQANRFHVYPREGTAANGHHHPLLKIVYTATQESDGSDVTSVALPGFPRGLFVAMSDDKTFQFYRWEDIAQVIGVSGSTKTGL